MNYIERKLEKIKLHCSLIDLKDYVIGVNFPCFELGGSSNFLKKRSPEPAVYMLCYQKFQFNPLKYFASNKFFS